MYQKLRSARNLAAAIRPPPKERHKSHYEKELKNCVGDFETANSMEIAF